MSDYLDPNNEELLKDFFSEAISQVEVLEQNILVLENDPHNKDAVDEIFRAAHTLKGGAATVQMFEISEFTHIVEDVLDEIRSGGISMNQDLVDVLLQAVDVVKDMMNERLEGRIFHKDVTDLKTSLKGFLAPPKSKKVSAPPVKNAPQPPSSASSPSVNPEKGLGDLTEYEYLELKEAANHEKIYRVSVNFDESNPMNSVGGIQVFAVLKEMGTVLKTVPEFDRLYEDTFFPTVDYFLVLKKDLEFLKKKVMIRDVTTGFSVMEIVEPPENKASPSNPISKDLAENKTEASVEVPDHEPEVAPEHEDDSGKGTLVSGESKKNSNSGSVLRVDSKRIDNLLNLVSETVINKATFNQISNHFSDHLMGFQSLNVSFKERMKEFFDHIPNYLNDLKNGKTIKELKKEMVQEYASLLSSFDPMENQLKNTVGVFKGTSQNLGRIIGELHEGVLRIRMVPISQIFSRFPRLVRDLSKTLNKKINLIIEGEDTELDKSVIEDLLDPLIHCVRNSLDHGIEVPAERLQSGKREEGRVLLSARNEGNMIIIEVSDDGKGIDVNAVKAKAVERGLIHPGKSLSDVEAFNLIFEPGFSTADKVTNISGRGVGLDVVRRQIEKLNGSVSVWSEKGKGTKFTVKLPLTLAIIQGLLVRVGTEIYALPITSVIDSHRILPSEIKVIDNYEVFNVRKDVISLLRLGRLFGIPSDESSAYNFIVVVGSGDKKMGLVVDSLIGEEDVVIKPLKDHYTASPGIAGATILGDGKVALIIDVSQLLELGLKNERIARQTRESLVK